MKHKTVSRTSSILLDNLHKANRSFFSISDACTIFHNKSGGAVRKKLKEMVDNGLLMRIQKGHYHVIPFDQDRNEYFPNWHKMGEALVGENYYVGFYSAMEIHGLITQPSLVEYVVTQKRIPVKSKKVGNARLEFVNFNENHFFGYEKKWIDDFNQVYCSDLEKTFIDCLYKPDYSGGIQEIIKALYQCKDKIDTKKMETYLEKFNTQVVFKRLGFICDKFNILEDLQQFILNKISESYTLLDPSIPTQGKCNSKWKVIDNIDINSTLTSIQS